MIFSSILDDKWKLVAEGHLAYGDPSADIVIISSLKEGKYKRLLPLLRDLIGSGKHIAIYVSREEEDVPRGSRGK